ncbi:MAG: metallophosphoesterase [Clostridia bacterium]|nr:metallophosphoesterase [Clostridia bacterium]
MIERTAERVKALRQQDSLVLLTFSDLHARGRTDPSSVRLAEWMGALTDAIPTHGVVDLGDNMGMLGRETHVTDPDLHRIMTDMFVAFRDAARCPFFPINGNHDAPGTDFFKPDFWNSLVRDELNALGAATTHGSWYYADLREDIRLVFLSAPWQSDRESEIPTPCWEFGEEQLAWLRDVALDTEKYVLLFCHVPMYDRYTGDMESMLDVWTGSRAAKAYISTLCGWIDDAPEAVAILEDFAKANPGKLVGEFSGHTHADSLWAPGETKGTVQNPLPCYQSVIRSFCLQGTAAMDILVVTPSLRRVDMIRVGDGEDRSFSF